MENSRRKPLELPSKCVVFDHIARILWSFVMLETIIVILLILWVFGAFVTPVPAIGGLVHLLLLVVLVVVVLRVLQGRRPIS